MTNLELAKKYEQYVIDLRRWFHTYPDMTGEEFGTIKKIRDELDRMGLEYVEIENGGLLGCIRFGTAERSVLLRADVDALPVQESEENLVGPRCCKSRKEGLMHACGHDGHTAMLLGALKILLEQKEKIDGTIYFMFERGEEYPDYYKNIFKYMEEHGIDPDSAWGIHLKSDVESGKIAISDGAMMGGSLPFTVTINGKGGHGSRPDLAQSPIDAFVAVYNGLQGMRVRQINPFQALTFSIGKIESGNIGNVIPDSLRFQGSVRMLDRENAGMPFAEEMKHMIDRICDAYHCEAEYTIGNPGYPVVNDPECAQLARDVIGKEIGKKHVIPAVPWMATDSFAYHLKLWPGVYAFLGIKNEKKGTGADHHNPQFDLDEDVLYLGSASTAAYAIEFLKSGIDNSSKKTPGGYRAILRDRKDAKTLLRLYNEKL